MALITVSGTQGIGKTTFIKDFLSNWPMFKTPDRTYRDVIRSKNLTINKNTTKESQGLILDSIIEIMESYPRHENIIFDRCPIDNLIYSLWAYEKGVGDFDGEFIAESIKKARRAMQRVDLMFLIPMTNQNPKLILDELRDSDEIYQKEIDEIFKGIKRIKDAGDDVFFVKDDSPPIIEIFGSRQERIEISKLYLKQDGTFYGDEDSLLYDAMGDMIGSDSEDIVDTGERDQLRNQLGLKKL